MFKHRNIKINEELQKVKDRDKLDNWKEDYRSSQQQLRRKRLVKGKGNFQIIFFSLDIFLLCKKIIKKQLYKLHLVLILIIFRLWIKINRKWLKKQSNMKVGEIVHRKVLCERKKKGNLICVNSDFNNLLFF